MRFDLQPQMIQTTLEHANGMTFIHVLFRVVGNVFEANHLDFVPHQCFFKGIQECHGRLLVRSGTLAKMKQLELVPDKLF